MDAQVKFLFMDRRQEPKSDTKVNTRFTRRSRNGVMSIAFDAQISTVQKHTRRCATGRKWHWSLLRMRVSFDFGSLCNVRTCFSFVETVFCCPVIFIKETIECRHLPSWLRFAPKLLCVTCLTFAYYQVVNMNRNFTLHKCTWNDCRCADVF